MLFSHCKPHKTCRARDSGSSVQGAAEEESFPRAGSERRPLCLSLCGRVPVAFSQLLHRLRSLRRRAERGLTPGPGPGSLDPLCQLLGPRPPHLWAAPQNLRTGKAHSTSPPRPRGCLWPPCPASVKWARLTRRWDRGEGRLRGRAGRPGLQLWPRSRLLLSGCGQAGRPHPHVSGAKVGPNLGEYHYGGAHVVLPAPSRLSFPEAQLWGTCRKIFPRQDSASQPS